MLTMTPIVLQLDTPSITLPTPAFREGSCSMKTVHAVPPDRLHAREHDHDHARDHDLDHDRDVTFTITTPCKLLCLTVYV